MLIPIYSLINRRSDRPKHLIKLAGQPIESNKAKLLLTITGLVIAILLPVIILPRINHPFFVYRTSIHLASITISIFLIVVSILTYRRTGSIKVLYTTIAFLSLLVVEFIFLLQIVDGSNRIMVPLAYSELPHILLLTMLALFGMGVLKVDK
jgi:hypothetical protein